MSFFKDKKVLVTGAAGLVGTNLINRMLFEGALIRATIHKKDPTVIDKKIEYVKCDLTDKDDCQKVVAGIDYVFHCAANTSGAAVLEKTPLVHVTENIVMHARLLEAAYLAKIKKFLLIMQGDPYEKYFCVGWMKRYTEVLCRIYAEKLQSPMATIVLRPTNIYGEYDDFEFETSHVLPALIRKVVERQNPIEVWGTGDDVRDLIYVGDFVDAMLLAMEKITNYDTFNIGLGQGYSVKEMLNIILEIEGIEGAKIIFDPSKPSTIPIRLVDTAKAAEILNFKASTELKEGIEKTIKWYRKNKMKGTGGADLCGNFFNDRYPDLFCD